MTPSVRCADSSLKEGAKKRAAPVLQHRDGKRRGGGPQKG